MEPVVKPFYTIDLDAPPVLTDPGRWDSRYLVHRKGGLITWDPSRFTGLLTKYQKEGKTGINGRAIRNELHRTLRSIPLLNVNMREFFLAHPEEIPARWRRYTLCFWGTLLSEHKGERFVPILYWNHRSEKLIADDLPIDGYGFTPLCAAAAFYGR